jgi:hypothetical protein
MPCRSAGKSKSHQLGTVCLLAPLTPSQPYTAFMPAPASCWAADISAVPNFWSDHQVNYDNQRGQTYSLAGRSDLDQLRPCCGSKEYVVTSGE